jgi:hypothetical protein|tara:strand:- start:3960 stop:4742 length:783 start_codon:yes stop_codon:yes gene_type:complete
MNTYIKWKDERPLIFDDWYGFKYHTSNKIDGGCVMHSKAMIEAVKALCPNKTWNFGLDYGCGDGGVGLAFQGSNLVKDFVYVDHYKPAVEGCVKNLKRNNLDSKVILADRIEYVKCNPIDFMFVNPPHHRTCELTKMYDLGWLEPGGIKEFTVGKEVAKHIPHRHFDLGWQFHKQMFWYIGGLCAPKADLFIFENGDQTSPIFWEWGRMYPGLKCEKWIDGKELGLLKQYYVMHISFDREVANEETALPENINMSPVPIG